MVEKDLLERWAAVDSKWCTVEWFENDPSAIYVRNVELRGSSRIAVYSKGFEAFNYANEDNFHPSRNWVNMHVQWANQSSIEERGWEMSISLSDGRWAASVVASPQAVHEESGDSAAEALLKAYVRALEAQQ